jgi:hypothetical protein
MAMPYIEYEVDTLLELVQAVQDAVTGGYELIEFKIEPRRERFRQGNGFFTVVTVNDEYSGYTGLNGEWWFDADGRVMQVL